MMPWFAFETRWRDTLLEAVLPGLNRNKVPSAFWPRFYGAAPLLLRAGFRIAVWCFSLAPLASRRPRLFATLHAAEQDAFLKRCNQHSFFLVRQLVLALKLMASFAYFEDPAARARFQTKENSSAVR